MARLDLAMSAVVARHGVLETAAADECRNMCQELAMKETPRTSGLVVRAKNAHKVKCIRIRRHLRAELAPMRVEKRLLERQACLRQVRALDDADFRELVAQVVTDTRYPALRSQ